MLVRRAIISSSSSRVPAAASRTITSSASSSSPSSDGQQQQPPRNPIFPGSKASSRRSRRVPNLFQYVGVNKSKAPADLKSKQKNKDSDANSLAVALRNLSTNPKLKDLCNSLAVAAYRFDVIKTLDITSQIHQHLQASSPQASVITTQHLPIFHALLKCFSKHGHLVECQGVIDDMQMSGLQVDLVSLNYLLEAAVFAGNSQAIHDTLNQISSLASHTSDSVPETASSSPPQNHGVLPNTSNWSSTTFTHLINSAYQSHNLEMALSLMATCLRNQVALEHDALRKILYLCFNTNEVRLAVELATASENGGLYTTTSDGQQSARVARRLESSLWMAMLAASAQNGYLPGVIHCWNRAVVTDLQTPDEGTLLRILAVAARDGHVDLAMAALERLHPGFGVLFGRVPVPDSAAPLSLKHAKRGLNMPRASLRPYRPGWTDPTDTQTRSLVMQEWHLAPLFEAHCQSHDFDGAIRAISLMKRCGHPVTPKSISMLAKICSNSPVLLNEAFQSLLRIGGDKNWGVDVVAVNALIYAAVLMDNPSTAIEIYKACWHLRDATLDPKAGQSQIAIPPNSLAADLSVSVGKWSPVDKGSVACVRPDLETYHQLILGCINTSDAETGRKLLTDLNALGLRPTTLTYERMIQLCLTQSSYEDAFGFMEQAKMSGLVPTRKSYEALILKCHSEQDERWKMVLDELEEAGHHLGNSIRLELGLNEEPMQPPGRTDAKSRGRPVRNVKTPFS